MNTIKIRQYIKEQLPSIITHVAKAELLAILDEMDGKLQTIPFQFPVPAGYRVVAQNGKELNLIVAVPDASNKVLIERDGCYRLYSIMDLHLEPIEPEMITVWMNEYEKGFVGHFTKEIADKKANTISHRIGEAFEVTFKKPNHG